MTCGHDGWVKGCPHCEAEHAYAMGLIGAEDEAEGEAALDIIRNAYPSFGEVIDILFELREDDSVTPYVYERVLYAVDLLVRAWAERGSDQ